MGSYMSLEIIFVCKSPRAIMAFVSDPHMSVFVMVSIFPNGIKTFITLLTPVSELIQMTQHMLFHVLFIHERTETKVAYSPIVMFHQVMHVEITVFVETFRAHIAVINETFPLFNVSEEGEPIDEQLLTSQTFEMRHIYVFVRF